MTKGDVFPGPGFVQADFTATGTDGGLPGDTSRAGVAEAMVWGLEYNSDDDNDKNKKKKYNGIRPLVIAINSKYCNYYCNPYYY